MHWAAWARARLQDCHWERRHARQQLLLQPVRRVLDHEVGRCGCRDGRACPPAVSHVDDAVTWPGL